MPQSLAVASSLGGQQLESDTYSPEYLCCECNAGSPGDTEVCSEYEMFYLCETWTVNLLKVLRFAEFCWDMSGVELSEDVTVCKGCSMVV